VIDSESSSGIRVRSDGAGHRVDVLSSVAGSMIVAACFGWIITGLVADRTVHDDNSMWLLLAICPTMTVSISATVMIAASIIRKYVRRLVDHDVAVVCQRIDKLFGVIRPQDSASSQASGSEMDDGWWRGYMAKQFELDTGKFDSDN
jgi:hypothetical protein